MKKLILIPLLFFSFSIPGICQQRIVEKHFTVKRNEKVALHLKFGNKITVKSWPKDEVFFKAAIEINQGKLNDALELHFDNQNSRLKIISDYDKEKIKAGRASDCPGNDYSMFSIDDDDIRYAVCADIIYTLFVPRNVDLKIKTIDSDINLSDLAGPIHIDAISGDITLTNLGGPVHAKSISGFVDLSWSPEKPARFAMKTISGQTYTNLDDLKITNESNHASPVGENVKARLGENGPVISLKTISGNIYLRKGEK